MLRLLAGKALPRRRGKRRGTALLLGPDDDGATKLQPQGQGTVIVEATVATTAVHAATTDAFLCILFRFSCWRRNERIVWLSGYFAVEYDGGAVAVAAAAVADSCRS